MNLGINCIKFERNVMEYNENIDYLISYNKKRVALFLAHTNEYII